MNLQLLLHALRQRFSKRGGWDEGNLLECNDLIIGRIPLYKNRTNSFTPSTSAATLLPTRPVPPSLVTVRVLRFPFAAALKETSNSAKFIFRKETADQRGFHTLNRS